MEAVVSTIRKADTLVPVLDAFCAVLPLILKEISAHEAEDPPLSFVLKNLAVSAVSSVISLFDLYYKAHYRIANFEKNDSVRERFMSYRLFDYVRLLQVASWFVPITPIFPEIDRKFYLTIEPLYKAVESDQIYSTFESKSLRLSNYWKSQAERDLINQGREVHK